MTPTTTKSIEIVVAPDGSSRIETRGFAGADCQMASRFLEQALGRRSSEQLKPEFYAAHQQSQSNAARAGQ